MTYKPRIIHFNSLSEVKSDGRKRKVSKFTGEDFHFSDRVNYKNYSFLQILFSDVAFVLSSTGAQHEVLAFPCIFQLATAC